MSHSAQAGKAEMYDALVTISAPPVSADPARATGGGADQVPAGLTVIIESPVRQLFGAHQDSAVNGVLAELSVTAGEVRVVDDHALDFVLRARVRAAVRRLRADGGRG